MTKPATPAPPDVLAARGVPFRLHEHPGVTSILDVCATLGVPLEQSVKTLAFALPGDRLLLAVLPGPARLRYGPLARAAATRRPDLTPASPEHLTRLGMLPGGVCPVTADDSALVVFDESVKGMGTVYCGSGRPDSTIEIEATSLLAALPMSTTAPIAALAPTA